MVLLLTQCHLAKMKPALKEAKREQQQSSRIVKDKATEGMHGY